MAKPGLYEPKMLQVPYRDDADLLFSHPVTWPGPYINVGKEIIYSYLKIPDRDKFTATLSNTKFCTPSIAPNGDYTIALIHAAFCNSKCRNDPEFGSAFEDIRTKFKDPITGWWIYNRNMWTSSGVYVMDDLQLKGANESFYLGELEEILKNGYEIKGVRFSKDAKVRFAPKQTYKIGEHTSDSLVEDGFVIASFGVKGAERFGEISAKFPDGNTVVSGIETDVPKQSVSMLSTLNVVIVGDLELMPRHLRVKGQKLCLYCHPGGDEDKLLGYASAVLGYKRLAGGSH